MKCLCEKCFPGQTRWADVEVLTIVPLMPCHECGKYDDRRNGGVAVHAFRSDPRTPGRAQKCVTCGGTGTYNFGAEKCEACHGTGFKPLDSLQSPANNQD